MHIVLFLQYYHTPDCPTAARPHALVNALATDHKVTLITTQTGRQRRITFNDDWVPPTVSVHELVVPYRNEMRPLQRIRAFGQYAAKATLHGFRIDAPDVILASSTPLSVPMVAACVAHHYGVPWIFEVRDLWPDFPIQMGTVPSAWAQRMLYALERKLYHSAAHVVALSPDMAAHVQGYVGRNRVTMNPYGTDLSLLRNASAKDVLCDVSNEQHLVLYAGSFGRANAIPTLLDAAARLQDRSDIVMLFVGAGYHEPTVREAARCLPNVRLLPSQPYPRTLALFKRADLSITSFINRPVLNANAPAKLYDSLAAGTPVIVTNGGWTKRLVESGECGWYVPPEDPNALELCIRQHADAPRSSHNRWARNAISLAHTRFDRACQMQSYRELVETIV